LEGELLKLINSELNISSLLFWDIQSYSVSPRHEVSGGVWQP